MVDCQNTRFRNSASKVSAVTGECTTQCIYQSYGCFKWPNWELHLSARCSEHQKWCVVWSPSSPAVYPTMLHGEYCTNGLMNSLSVYWKEGTNPSWNPLEFYQVFPCNKGATIPLKLQYSASFKTGHCLWNSANSQHAWFVRLKQPLNVKTLNIKDGYVYSRTLNKTITMLEVNKTNIMQFSYVRMNENIDY